MKNVIFRGPCLTQSGYGIHARQIVKWLLSRKDFNVKFQILPWGNTPWLLNRDNCNGMIGKILDNSASPDEKNFDISFQLQLPNEWDKNLAKYNIGITAGVETDICNKAWLSCCNSMNKVVVPSTFTKSLFIKDCNNVSVIPEEYNEECVVKQQEDIFNFSTNFNFLLFGQLTGTQPEIDRKNILNTIKWLLEEFENNKDVGLILKLNAGRNTLIDRDMISSIVKQVATEIRKTNFPKIHLIHGDLSDKEIATLYQHNSVKAFVSATRGEGFCLPMIDAVVSGIPVIATNWSGHLDYLNHGKFIPLYYDLKDIHKSKIDNQIFVEGARWAEVSEVDFKKKVKKFYNKPEIPKEWANNLKDIVKEKYSHTNISNMYNQLIEEIC